MAPLAAPLASDPRVAFPSAPAAPQRLRTAGLQAASRGMALSLIAACALTACNRQNASPLVPPPAPSAAAAPAAAPASEAAPVAVRYAPPSADALYQMVAPIALYPDKLVAQVLAGATYPDQITAAETWLGQNPSLKAAALTDAVDQQPWDPSIKSLTAFPNVLEQMASNLPWTVALGKAYYNDPTDVMNAIQVMRSRAAKAGSLKSSPHLRVATVTGAQPSPPPPPDLQQPFAVYGGPAVVVPPPTYISIEPAEVQAVYVPRYDPQVVYGTPVPLYSSYRWATPPAPVYSTGVVAGVDPVAVGALAFGAGVLVGVAASHHHHWGWDAWGVNWGQPPERAAWVQGAPLPPPVVRPAVVYRGNTYISQSRTVVENIHNRVTVNNFYEHAPEGGRPPAMAATMPVAPTAPMAAMNPMASPVARDRDHQAMAQAAMLPHAPGQDRHAMSPGQLGQPGAMPSPRAQALAMQPLPLQGAHALQPAARADEQRMQAQRAAIQSAQPSHPVLPMHAVDGRPAPGAAPMRGLAAAPSNRPELPAPHSVQAAPVPTAGQTPYHENPRPPMAAGPGAQAQAQRAVPRPEHVPHPAPQAPAQVAAEHAQMRMPPPAMQQPAHAMPPQERAAPRPAPVQPPHVSPAPSQHGHGAEPAHRPEGHRHGET